MTNKSDIEQLFRSNYPAMLTLAIYVTPAYLLTGVRFASLKYLRSLSLRDRFNNLYALDLDEIDDDGWPDPEENSTVLLICLIKVTTLFR